MDPVRSFVYAPLDMRVLIGRGAVRSLAEELDRSGCRRALVITGPHVGANTDVMDPICDALGERLAGTFRETSTRKSAASVFAAIDAMRETEADVLIGVGGGSSLDTARQASVFAQDGRSLEDYADLARAGELRGIPTAEGRTPVVVVPTTLAGADLQSGGAVEFLDAAHSPTGMPYRVGGRLAPLSAIYDPDIISRTPIGALFGSAMNGYNKGLETLYGAETSTVSDATAVRGLQLLRRGLLELAEGDPAAMDAVVDGILLVQVDLQTSIIHAYGHGFSRQFPVQQGHIHAIIGPHVLRSVADRLQASRLALMAEAVDLPSPDQATTEQVVERVIALRDALDLPSRLSDLLEEGQLDIEATAAFIRSDPTIDKVHASLMPSVDEIAEVLRQAW